MKHLLKRLGLTIILLSISIPSFAQDQGLDSALRNRTLDSLIEWQVPDTLQAQRISYSRFIESVLAHNLDYSVQRYNVSIAQAEIAIAKIYPNPVVSAALSKDVTAGLPGDSIGGNVLSLGISQTILLGGKLSKAVDVASAEKTTAEASLSNFFWTLRANAAQAYITAAIADSNYDEAMHTYQELANLAQINASRMNAGDIGRTDFIQSRVDAIQARGEVLQADAARRAAFLALGQLMGEHNALYRPDGNLIVPTRSFNLDDLIAHADTARSDLIAARDQVESERLGVSLARALQWPDLTVGIGYTTTAATTAFPAPFPNQRVIGINLSIPIPISATFNHGAIDAAEFNYEQSRDSLSALKLTIETSVRQAYTHYELAHEQYLQYSTGLLHDAETVWAARLYSYKAGSAELLDVLTAENTLASVYQAYYASLSDYTSALISLESSSQVWNIQF